MKPPIIIQQAAVCFTPWVLMGLLAACANQQVAESSVLAGTAWQLAAIQSMDDAQGTTHIEDPQLFTLRFEPDGKATLRLYCNLGTGTWQATPAASDPNSGTLTFGPIAATRALCPPPYVGERVVRDLGYIRSYLLKDGKLYLSLMADGGIYEWLPLGKER